MKKVCWACGSVINECVREEGVKHDPDDGDVYRVVRYRCPRCNALLERDEIWEG